jgi:hypothetical protein
MVAYPLHAIGEVKVGKKPVNVNEFAKDYSRAFK